MVLHDLAEKHWWSIKTFIHHLVTAEPAEPYNIGCLARAKALSDAIYQQLEVVEQLSCVSEDI
jgi:hypothetical protein